MKDGEALRVFVVSALAGPDDKPIIANPNHTVNSRLVIVGEGMTREAACSDAESCLRSAGAKWVTITSVARDTETEVASEQLTAEMVRVMRRE